ncbi:MAG: Ig-like domain-containing protein [Euryarchaeota archaeon]|nr:Ig-like domain-containing protein [Euryarchaeota archaeon]
MSARSLVLCGLLVLATFSGVQAFPEEDSNFQPPHSGPDFPVGYIDFSVNQQGPPGQDHRLVYPAMVAGEDSEVAGNGPFPWMVLIVDENESPGNYMLLCSRIAQAGTMVYIPSWPTNLESMEDFVSQLEEIQEWIHNANQSNEAVLGMFGSVDESHWGLIGHGVGAVLATNGYINWLSTATNQTAQPPRAIVGLALEVDEVNEPLTIQAPAPNIGLFITGSADEVAPATEHVLPVLENVDGFAWQILHSLGANHYQYQDSSSFLEDFNDGDASLTQEEQLDHAMEHVLPYLDLTLRGDHSSFREAFNRPNDVNTVTDSNGYVDEDFDEAQLIPLSTPISLNGTLFSPTDDAVFVASWSMRNGDQYDDIPSNWTVTAECMLDNSTVVSGVINNDEARCVVPMGGVSPGAHQIKLMVFVEGGSGFITFDFNRTNDPIGLIDPHPELLVPQRGYAHLDSSEIAIDPDGQAIEIINATLLDNESHFNVIIDADLLGFTLTHSLDEEWEGTTRIALELKAGGAILDILNVTLNASILPINDPLIQISTVGQQVVDEDSPAVWFDASQYISDPEGAPLSMEINGLLQGEGELLAWFVEPSNDTIRFTPLPNANGAEVFTLSASDGFNTPLSIDVPFRVNAMNDAFDVTESAWDIALEEEGTLLLSLLDFAVDTDGDALVWELESEGSTKSQMAISGQELLISALIDVNGIDNGWWLNVTDGDDVFEKRITLTISPEPDRPILSNGSITKTSDDTLLLQWVWSDADSDSEMDVIVNLNGVLQSGMIDCDSSGVCSQIFTAEQVEGEILQFDIIAKDSAFADVSMRVQYTVPIESETPSSDSDGSSSGSSTLLAAVIIVPLVALVGWMLLQVRKPPQQPELEDQSGGLLARAERKINES